ncbi:GRAM domain-containing protein 4 isoform X2 [Aplysia californica]|nr:GRAM domain-containing protein 4 isoform X2 [Aplysia californica]
MSFTKNLRQRFKTEKEERKDKLGHSPAHGEEDVFEFVDSGDELSKSPPATERMHPQQVEEACSTPVQAGADSPSGRWSSVEERQIFEEQLNQLQDQLMIASIENQTQQNELNHYRNKSEVLEKVKSELMYERHRCELLEKKLENLNKKRSHKVHRSHSDLSGKDNLSVPGGSGGSSPAGGSPGDRADSGDENAEELVVPQRKRRFYHHFFQYIVGSFNSFAEDFTDEPIRQAEGDPEGDPLTVKKLKENIKRFGTEAKPYLNTIRGIGEILAWKSPPYTLIVFVVYMYSVWMGWFLPVLLFCLTFRLFINYLRHRGWNVHFNFFETAEEAKESEEKDMGMSDKLNLVMQVARKVQNFLGEVADSLEKIKSMLTWRHPEASRQLLIMVTAAFITSCILPTPLLFFYAGLYLGIKLFIIDYIFNRFPRVKRKYDSTYRMWQELPTDLEFERRYVKSEMDKYILPSGQEKVDPHLDSKSDHVSMDDRTFCELFSLPESECPLPGWHSGRRCTLINREKSLTAAFKNGRLYLTHSFLCFERTKVPSPKNIVIPLADIARLEKARPYSWMPGGGMAIEIVVVGNEKPFVFGCMLSRDELYDSICEAGLKKLSESSQDDSSLPWMQHLANKKHFVPKHFQPFTLGNVYEDSD